MNLVRVAAAQFAAGTDVQENAKKVLAVIDRAAGVSPALLVLPEFANHASWYLDRDHCYAVALGLGDPLITAVSERAKIHGFFIVLNVTLKRPGGVTTGSSILFDRRGGILAISDKQVLMGHENEFLKSATSVSPVVETEIGRLGLYACMDGVIPETPRGLAVRGAQILCNSLNSFALDEASLHVPVRAAENKVFVVAANKVGPLIPEDQIEAVSRMVHIPRHFLYGAGESQIVAPDGTVLAKASLSGEEIIHADIDPRLADRKARPSGLSSFASRRPELYRALAEPRVSEERPVRDQPVRVATWQGHVRGEGAIEEFCAALLGLDHLYDLVVLPELFFLEHMQGVTVDEAVALSSKALGALSAALAGLKVRVIGSFVLPSAPGAEFSDAVCPGPQHFGLCVGAEGVILCQPQLHASSRFTADLPLGNAVEVVDLEWGRLGIVVGEDAVYPEVFRLAALSGADLIAIPGHLEERWEVELGLPERAAENRMTLAFATRPGLAGASLLADLEDDFTLLTPWSERIFDGNINAPRLHLATRGAQLTGHVLHPARSRNKILSGKTHVLDSRPWAIHDMG